MPIARALLGALLLAGCEVREQRTALSAPDLLVGMASNDLRLCAGLPDRNAAGTNGARFWSYERSATVGTGSVSLTQIGVSLSGAEECRATFELSGERVARVAFTRIAGSPGAPAASCAPLVSTCVEMVRQGRIGRVAMPPPGEPKAP